MQINRVPMQCMFTCALQRCRDSNTQLWARPPPQAPLPATDSPTHTAVLTHFLRYSTRRSSALDSIPPGTTPSDSPPHTLLW